jgi:hypothetical protein
MSTLATQPAHATGESAIGGDLPHRLGSDTVAADLDRVQPAGVVREPA